MRLRLLGLLAGILAFYPGAEVLRWLVVDVLGLYSDMTLQEALLAEAVILLTAFLLGGPGTSRAPSGASSGESRPTSSRSRRGSS